MTMNDWAMPKMTINNRRKAPNDFLLFVTQVASKITLKGYTFEV